MKVYHKQWELTIPKPLDEVWDFFSRPENLNEMTPKDMEFEILSDIKGVEMYEGMIIQYNVAPVLSIKMGWTTEITHIKEKQFFVDEQRSGPYAMWHHQHHFEEVAEGVKMKDILHYAMPLGPIGQIVNAVFVGNKIEQIFAYREEMTQSIFSKNKIYVE